MNIQDELKNDRLAVDFEHCRVFIRQDLYGEMLDTSVFPHALRVIKMSWWKKLWICLCMKCFPKRCEQYVREGQFLYHLTRLSDYINEWKTKYFFTPEGKGRIIIFLLCIGFWIMLGLMMWSMGF